MARRPLDEVIEAGPPVNPIRFRPPIYHRARRADDVIVYDSATQLYFPASRVLFRDYLTAAYTSTSIRASGRTIDSLRYAPIAYWRIPSKQQVKTLSGYIEVCHVLKRSFGEHNRQASSDQVGYVSDQDKDNDIVFCLSTEKVAIKSHQWDVTRRLQGHHAENPLNEIAAMQSLPTHPNVLTCTEVLFDGENLHVVMPFISRGDLHDRMEYIKRTNPHPPLSFRGLSETEAHYYFCQLLNGIRHLQANGLCHRDLSPENVMFSEDYQTVVIDLGMSLLVPYSSSDGTDTVTDVRRGRVRRLILPQHACGKLRYISPEVFISREPFDGFSVDM